MIKQIKEQIKALKNDPHLLHDVNKMMHLNELYKLHKNLKMDMDNVEEMVSDEYEGGEMYLKLAIEATDPEIKKLRKMQAAQEAEHAKINQYIAEKMGYEVDDMTGYYNDIMRRVKAV